MAPHPDPIRRAGLSDSALLAAIHAECFAVPDRWSVGVFQLQLELPNVLSLLHADGGLILCRVAADEAEVLTLAVLPQVRRQGIAAALIAESVQRLGWQGVRTLFLEVSVANDAARGLYAGLGFGEVGRRRNYYPDRTDALVLRLDVPFLS